MIYYLWHTDILLCYISNAPNFRKSNWTHTKWHGLALVTPYEITTYQYNKRTAKTKSLEHCEMFNDWSPKLFFFSFCFVCVCVYFLVVLLCFCFCHPFSMPSIDLQAIVSMVRILLNDKIICECDAIKIHACEHFANSPKITSHIKAKVASELKLILNKAQFDAYKNQNAFG